jgi:hypothetical protein
MQKRISILNAVSGAADCVTANGLTFITGLTPFHATDLQSFQIVRNLVATPQRWTYSIPLVNSGVVSFRVIQTVNGLVRDAVFTYTFAATASSSELKTAIDNWYAAQGFSGSNTVTAASPTTGVLVGSASNTNIQMTAITGLTVTYAMPTIAPHATAGTALAGTTTVTCTTLAAQTFATGETVTVVAGTGYTFTQNGVSGLTSVTARITYATSTTFTLNGVVGAGTNGSAPTFTKVAQAGFGSIADVNADALLNGSTQTATQTTYQYNCAQIRGTYPVATNGSLQVADVYEATLWYPANLIASTFDPFTNTAALETLLAALVV